MKKLFVTFLCLILGLIGYAQVSKLVNVTSGGLSAALTGTQTSVTTLTITGSIDARDFKCMRDEFTALSILDISSVTINAYTGNEGPNLYINSYAANIIPDWAFCTSALDGKKSLKTVLLPKTITSISQHAFDYCSGITNITIPDAVTSIGDYAFRSCMGATSLTIGKSVKTIGKSAFSLCYGLTTILIPESVTSIGDIAFSGCSAVTTVNLSSFLTSIGGFAFQDCTSLISITIPISVTSIGTRAFGGCVGLKSIYANRATPVDLTNSLEVFRYANYTACTLYVPIGRIPAYQTAIQWKDFLIKESAISAITTLQSESIFLYPNPTKDVFHIAGLEDACFITLIDLNGKNLFTRQATPNEIITIGSLPKGMYILKIRTATGEVKKRLIKE